MKIQHLLSYVRRAIQDYDMIQEGDRIAVGISAGKDSLALLLALSYLKRFYPKSFELEAVTVSLGFDNFDLSGVIKLCEQLGVRYTVYETEIAKIIFEERKESNPCSLCSKMRKAALYNKAKELGCNKIALGHNKDDINETLLMSLLYEGRIHTMPPVMTFEEGDLTLIRPLIYVPEKDIRYFVKKEALPVVKSPCPADGNTKRETTKQLIYGLEKEIPDLSSRLFGAVERSRIEGWGIKGR
ncbi:MAG: tRNA 2-thiocytidine biosynthesis TtcA family protein [Cellulosilyticaceae bacterium]